MSLKQPKTYSVDGAYLGLSGLFIEIRCYLGSVLLFEGFATGFVCCGCGFGGIVVMLNLLLDI
jgi:hypothetical protein